MAWQTASTLLECLEDNFLVQMIKNKQTNKGDVLLDLLLTNEGLIRGVRIGGSLGNNCRSTRIYNLERYRQGKSMVKAQSFRKTIFHLFKGRMDGTCWETVIKHKGAEESWEIFKCTFLREQELSIPTCKKLGKEVRRSASLSQDLLTKLKYKNEMHRQWRQEHASWEDYRNMAWECRDGIRRAKAQLVLNLARNTENKKKSFYRYIKGILDKE